MSRVTGIGAIHALTAAAIVNALLLLVGLRYLINHIAVERPDATAFYMLVFILLLWGDDPWQYSGFFYFRMIGGVLPYPSTFSTALTFFTIAMYLQYLDTRQVSLWIAVLAISAMVALTHPLSEIFLWSALIAAVLAKKRQHWREYLLLCGLICATVILAALWPYYPFLKLLLTESNVYDAQNQFIYNQVFKRIYPAVLLGVPFLIWKLRSDWHQISLFMLLILGGIYGYGFLFGRWSYGRDIIFIIFTFHFVIADGFAHIENRIPNFKSPPEISKIAFSGIVTIVCVTMAFNNMIAPVLKEYIPWQPSSYHAYAFMAQDVRQYDVVLSDIRTSFWIPTFGGKVVAAYHPLAFVTDQRQRVRDVNFFFSDKASSEDRQRIISKNHVNYLLLNKSDTPDREEIAIEFESIGGIVYNNDDFLLLSLKT